MRKGSCLCGAVSFEVDQELSAPDACHCTQCRRHSGHVFASTNVARERLTVRGEESVRWFRSSDKARRGFCSNCGSSLFWDPLELDYVAVAMGAFEKPTGTSLAVHIWVTDKGDYYEIGDLVPREPEEAPS